jgi:putative colanic acid biosysnthesis UDP-glucose lipid carrier transferase
LNPISKNTAARAMPATNWQHNHQNGIVRSFVARRKNFLMAKRGFDIFFSALIILLVLSWFTPVIALLIKINSKGPVLFRQKRIGRNGVPFYCYKFRTMIVNEEADEVQAEENDKRITKVGRLLRRTNLDELPQFINVLLGDMSVIGPRPHMVVDCIRFSFVIPSYSFRHLVRPGITGWAQVNGCHGPTVDYDSVVLRYYWDAMYVRKAGFWLDLKIFRATLVRSLLNGVRSAWN